MSRRLFRLYRLHTGEFSALAALHLASWPAQLFVGHQGVGNLPELGFLGRALYKTLQLISALDEEHVHHVRTLVKCATGPGDGMFLTADD